MATADAFMVMDVEASDPRLPMLLALDRPVVLIGVPDFPSGLTCLDLDFTAAGSVCVAAPRRPRPPQNRTPSMITVSGDGRSLVSPSAIRNDIPGALVPPKPVSAEVAVEGRRGSIVNGAITGIIEVVDTDTGVDTSAAPS